MADKVENQYLAFGIDGDTYGVPVAKVREVLEYIKPTKLPKTADFLKGIINLRNVGIPVVDLRIKFGLLEREPTLDTAILVIEINSDDGLILIGAIADTVYEVIELDETLLEPPPRFGIKIGAQFIRNIGRREDRFIMIVDLDQAFSAADEALKLEGAAVEEIES